MGYDHVIEMLLAPRTHWQVEVEVSNRQLPKFNLGVEIAAIPLRILSGSTCGNTEILEDEVLSNKVFEKN